ncbi:MAG: transposase [Victivallaceae bacterium]|nr:transposase [Victivallaceae bacterium]
MPELATVFRDHIDKYPYVLTPEQRHAVRDICACRTPEIGRWAHYVCPECGGEHFAWASCGNRNCPKCGQDKVVKFLARQQENLLPVNYFMITVTLPHELNVVCRKHPVEVFNAFFRSATEAIKELAADPHYLGGQGGMLATLQTWSRNKNYHVHIHYLVPGGGLSPDGKYWLFPRNRDFLIAAPPLSDLVRGKMRTALKDLKLYAQTPLRAWDKHWVSDCRNVGNGMSTFKYLAFYMHRGAISNKDIVAYDGENVSFKYTESNSDVVRYRTLPALEFIRLCLRHVLPSGFQKTRYYGLLASANRKTVRELRLMILTTRYSRVPELEDFILEPLICPKCGMPMLFRGTYSRAPPSSVIAPGGDW